MFGFDTENLVFPINKMNYEMKMDAKKLLVSFSLIVSLLFLAVFASAATSEIANVTSVEVNGVDNALGSQDVAVVAGDVVPVKIVFEALEDASDVRIEADLEGQKHDSSVEVNVGDVEAGKRYTRTFNMRVPSDLQEEVSDNLTLNIKIENSDFKTELSEITLRVQRPSYDTGVMSISSQGTVNAGETFPVDVVLKNTGYNKLNDLYVKVSIPALGVERTVYFGDIVAVETDDDDDKEGDTVRGRVFLDVPYGAQQGVYTVEVEVSNEDMTVNQAKQIFVQNEVPQTVLQSGNSLILVNPTNNLKVYNVIADAPATVSDSVVVVPAGSSKTVAVSPNSADSFSVNVLSNGEVVGTVQFSNVEGSKSSSGVAVLTVVLAIIFIVLLIVLVVLLTKRPEDKDEELEESYY